MTDPSLRSRAGFNPASLNRMDTTRLANYRANLDFYQGNHWPTTSPARQGLAGGRHRQLVFNYAKVSIDKVTSFLMQGLGFACYSVEGTDELKARVRRAEQLLHQVYEQNNLQQLDYETEVDTAILGDGCYKVIWDSGDNRILEEVLDPDLSGLGIDILEQVYDPNLQTATRAQERADAILRTRAQEAEPAVITVGTNVGQELLDVVGVTDERCGISGEKYRVQAIQTDYNRRQGIYTQRLALCAP